jgi:diguanylate cyclase (GGDEF)-like protein
MGSDPDRLLKLTTLFSSCSDGDLFVIASHSSFLDFAEQDTVFSEGDRSERFYVVDSGEVVIRKQADGGIPVDIARFLEGDVFGELDMFTGENRNATAIASSGTRLLVFPDGANDFKDILTDHPLVSARLLHTFLVQVSARIRGVNILVKENSPLIRELKRQVYVDKLTGLNNKTFFEETLERILSNQGIGETTGLLMYKPDNFKAINDNFGHEAGDRVLRYIADGLCEIVKDRDMLFRYMGNENALVLPGAGRMELLEWAEVLGDYLRSLDLGEIIGDNSFRLSVSFALGMAPEHGKDAQSLINAVHPLSLEGRQRGGNCCLFPGDSSWL